MAKKIIGIGTTANDGTGDALRTAFDKCNDNFTELYDTTGFANNNTTSALSLSTLNSTYSTAVQGFRVFALDITTGALVYIKTATGWASSAVTIVV